MLLVGFFAVAVNSVWHWVQGPHWWYVVVCFVSLVVVVECDGKVMENGRTESNKLGNAGILDSKSIINLEMK